MPKMLSEQELAKLQGKTQDCSFGISPNKTPVDLFGKDYIVSIIKRLLFSKEDDPYSGGGVNFAAIVYKDQDAVEPYITKIETLMRDRTNFTPVSTRIDISDQRALLTMQFYANNQLMTIAIDNDENYRFFD